MKKILITILSMMLVLTVMMQIPVCKLSAAGTLPMVYPTTIPDWDKTTYPYLTMFYLMYNGRAVYYINMTKSPMIYFYYTNPSDGTFRLNANYSTSPLDKAYCGAKDVPTWALSAPMNNLRIQEYTCIYSNYDMYTSASTLYHAKTDISLLRTYLSSVELIMNMNVNDYMPPNYVPIYQNVFTWQPVEINPEMVEPFYTILSWAVTPINMAGAIGEKALNLVAYLSVFLQGMPNLIFDLFKDPIATVSMFVSQLTVAVQVNFNTITDYIKNTYDSLVDLPSTINTYIGNLFRNFLEQDIIGNLIALKDKLTNIPTDIVNGIKDFMLPDPEYIPGRINAMIDAFKGAFGITNFDISSIAGGSAVPTNDLFAGTINMGSHAFTANFVNTDALVTAVTKFRPYIRGFVGFLLMLFNVNQILGFIRQTPLAVHAVNTSNKDSH